jgi:phage terminase large subunit-like protein
VIADPVRDYAEAVLDRAIVAGPLVRLAAARHLADVKRARRRASGLLWDLEEANRILDLFGAFRLPTGQPFKLEPPQQFIVGSLFGWQTRDGGRRFRTAYNEMAKGNGKTPTAGGIGIVGLIADGTPRAEIYTAGVTRDQAQYLFRDADAIVEQSIALRRLIERRVSNLAVLSTGSYMRPVSSEGRSLDQKRVHIALIDEIHEHPDDVVVEKMRAGTKGDDRALIFEVTNSGYDRTSICWRHHEYSRQVLEGVIDNDSWFAYIACLDEGDDWMNDESCWPKANPLLDVTVTRRYLREQVQEARDMPAKANLVARLNFCVWTDSSAGAIPLEQWNHEEARKPPAIAKGATVYGGLDLTSTTDIASLLLEFEAPDGSIDVVCRFWCPQAAIEQRSRRDHLPYDIWVRGGHLIETPGDVTDYDAILKELEALAGEYSIAEIGFVRLNATQFVTAAGGLTTMVPISQTYTGLSAGTKDWLKRLAEHKVRHGGHPVLAWMASNLVVDQSPTGDMKPSLEHSTERISGQLAGILALTRLTAPHDQAPPEPGMLEYYRKRAAAGGAPPEEAGDDVDPGADPGEPAAPCGTLSRVGSVIVACTRDAGHQGGHGLRT